MSTKIHEISFEANKIYHRTGKTPAQLEETNRELLEALKCLLKEARANSFELDGSVTDTPAEAKAAAAIQKAEQ